MTISSTISETKKEEISLSLSDMNVSEIRSLYQLISSAPLPDRRNFYELGSYIKKNFVESGRI